jgi:DnaK suppressor protein
MADRKKGNKKSVKKAVKNISAAAVKTKPKTADKKSATLKKAAKKTAPETKHNPYPKKAFSNKSDSGKPPIKAKATAYRKKQTVSKKAMPGKRYEKESEEERISNLRKTLLQKRAEIIKEVRTEISKYIKGETRQLVDTALDDGDWATVDLSEDISLRHLSAHREDIRKIDESLRKIKEGTYGKCEDCGEEISEERLKVMPFAIYCVDCQEKRELFEAIERKEGL